MEDIRGLILSRKPGVNEQDIMNAEEVLGAKFPIQYTQLLILVNQPEIEEWILYPIKDSIRIAKTSDDIIRNNKPEALPFGFPQDLISIGYDGTGDLLCYKVDPSTNLMLNELFIWKHEDAEFEKIFEDLRHMIIELQS